METTPMVNRGLAPASSQRLVMSRGPHCSQVFMLDREGMTLGRHSSNNIVVDHQVVSRHHARITRQGQATVIEDLGSANGTFVNGVRLTAARPLTNGDVIGLGQEGAVRFTYQCAPPASQ